MTPDIFSNSERSQAMRERILIVEDEGLLAKELQIKLSRMGYVVAGIAATGEDALQLAEARRPDLVLMDIHLSGGLDGVETADLIFERFRIPSVYLTAYSDDQTARRAKLSQSFGYILKPLRERELETTLALALHKNALNEELRQHREHLEALVHARTSDLMQTNQRLRQEMAERLTIAAELQQHRDHLEELVEERTAELQDANRQLAHEIAARQRIEQELRQAKQNAEEAQNAAEKASRAKSEFLANMSHELRTPLTAMLGFAQLIVDNADSGPSAREYADIILRSGEHLLLLINDVLDMSTIEAGRCVLTPVRFNLCAMLATIEGLMRIRAEQQGLQFSVACAPEVPRDLIADENKLRQVLVNLLSNAIKFTHHGRVALTIDNCRLTIDDCEEAAVNRQSSIVNLRFSVSDTGIGIAAEELDAIFHAFERGRASAEIEGTGLGLSISQKFVRLMGGQITIESCVGAGSTFAFTIPVERAGAGSVVPDTYPALDAPRATAVQDGGAPPALPQALAGLPPGLRQELEQALTQLDSKRIGQAVDAIRPQHPRTAATLQHLAQTFRYREILTALREAQAHHSASPSTASGG